MRPDYWPLYRCSPPEAEHGTPFHLDSKEPVTPVAEFVATEARFATLRRTDPDRAAALGALLTRQVLSAFELSSPWELCLSLRWARHPPTIAARSVPGGEERHRFRTRCRQSSPRRRRRGDDDVGTCATVPSTSARVEAELLAWAAEHEYESVDQLRGSVSHANTADPAAFERANYVRTLHSWVAPIPLTPTAPSRG